jgi:hypothetical protein
MMPPEDNDSSNFAAAQPPSLLDEGTTAESWLRESEQSVEWIFCLTAARVLVANQEQR